MTRFFNPLNWIAWAGQFFFAWLSSIRWQSAKFSIPAFIVILALVGGVTLTMGSTAGWRARMLDRQLGNAYQQGNYKVTELLLKRRLRSEPEDSRLKLQLAQVLEKQGDSEQAAGIFQELAVKESDPGAAKWLLQNEFEFTPNVDWDERKLEQYGALAEVVLKAEPENLAAHVARANFLLKERKPREAVEHVKKLVKAQPLQSLELGKLYRLIGDETLAMQAAENYVAFVDQALKQNQNETQLRVMHAAGLIFMNRQEDAIRSLLSGYRESKDDRLRPLIAQTYILLANKIAQDSDKPNALLTRLQLIDQACKFAPQDPLVLQALSDTILASANDDDPQVEALRKGLLQGASPGIAHFIQGTVAMLKGDTDAATMELELASRDLPQSAAILNNLAVAKVSSVSETKDPTVLEEALGLVEKAIELAQKRADGGVQLPYYLETRAQVLLAQGKYLDAIADFERALPVPALKLGAHQGLAKAYLALNRTEIAQEHELAAEELIRRKTAAEAEGKSAIEAFGDSLRKNAEPAPESSAEGSH